MRAVSCRSALAVVGLLVLVSPTPATAWADLLGAGSTSDPVRPLVAAAALLAHGLAAWLLLTAALTAGARRSDAWGRLSDYVLRRVAPATVRRGVALALGLGVSLAAAPASAHDAAPAPTVTAPVPDLDWPQAGPGDPAPAAPERSTRPPRPAASREPADGVHTVVVRRGDTLWDLAAARLPRPSAQRVAQAWPAWWQVNRAVIGDDPDLLFPGQRLRVPEAQR